MRVLTLFLVVIAATAPTYADNWPQWRGPSGAAVSTERNRLLASPAISGGWLFLRADDSLVAVSGQPMG